MSKTAKRTARQQKASTRGRQAPPGKLDGTAFRFRWRYALLVFVVALCFRGLYLLEAGGHRDFALFYMDQEYHLEWARSLAWGHWSPPYDQLRDGPYFRAPLYPYFLAGVLRLFADSVLLARVVQILIGSASCALAYGVGAKCLGQRVGLVTGMLCALYWVLAYFDGELLLPVLLVFLVLLGMLMAFLATERQSVALAGLAGLALGLFAITRPNILVFLPFVIWWSIGVARDLGIKKAVAFVGLLTAGCALPPLAVTIRNGVVSGDWVVIASQGGVNFYIGNNPDSNGMQAVVPGTRQTWWGGYEDTVAIAEKAAGRPLKASEVSDYWFRRSFAYIREQPGHWLRLTLRKALAFTGDVELPNNKPYEARRKEYWTLRIVPLGFGVLFGLFLVALPMMLWPRRFATHAVVGGKLQRRFVSLILQFLLVYALTVIAFFVTGRYRVPLVPFIGMGAALTLVTLVDLFRVRRFGRFVMILAVAAMLIVPLRIDHFGLRKATAGFAELSEAQDQLDCGELDGAIDKLEAIRVQRTVRAVEVYTSLIRAYVERNAPGDKRAILRAAEDGLQQYPDEPELLWYAALGQVESGDWQQASEYVERYLATKPQDMRALYLGFTAALARGQVPQAEQYLARARAIDEHHPLVLEMQRALDSANP